MKLRPIQNYTESQRVEPIIQRRLLGTPYRAYASVPVSQVIAKESVDGRLPQSDFNILTMGEFDFVIARRATRTACLLSSLMGLITGPNQSKSSGTKRRIASVRKPGSRFLGSDSMRLRNTTR